VTRAALAAFLAALVVPTVAAAFDNAEPLAANEWYLEQDHAWAYWPTEPRLFPVLIAVIDSGIDGTHPDLVGRVVAAKSFVGGSPYRDDQGHGTFVAGEIAANPSNEVGIAGLAFNARLLVAKVVDPDGTVSLLGEVAAIRWAVAEGARVINLSLGGVRDPLNGALDTYSPLEQAAIDYAYSKGVVVVAAVGNGPQSPATPWPFAHYPAALPHVIGVSAIRRDGSVPDYSNRDVVYNDLAAPGDNMFSTIPTNLVEPGMDCADRPYSDCGPLEFRNAIGTSFAAPQVSAAAALLLGQDPSLKPEQVAWLLERGADDLNPATGCARCPEGRDRFTGWGALDVERSLALLSEVPPADSYEPNDDAGAWSHALPPLPRAIQATLDYWDDDVDVYRVFLRRGSRVFSRATPDISGSVRMDLYAPGTGRLEGIAVQRSRLVTSVSAQNGQSRLAYTARETGTYYLELKLIRKTRVPVRYTLAVARS
jgi:Subtilase family